MTVIAPGPAPDRPMVALLLVAALTAMAGQARARDWPTTEVAVHTVAGASHRFVVEVADTHALRLRGLMFRDTLAPDGGMLFDFNREGQVSMWMVNTRIPLDMLFIDTDGRIVRIVASAAPLSSERVPSLRPVRAVLELNAGTAARLGIGVGDRVVHAIFAPRPIGGGTTATTATRR